MSVDAASLNTLTRSLFKPRDVTSSLMGGAFSYGSNLSKTQKSSLANLESYIHDHVKGDKAIEMGKKMASLRVVMEMTNSFAPKRSSAYDMTTDRFGSNGASSFLGIFYNQLL